MQTIAPSSALPPITDPVTIDGTTQPGYGGAPLIELSGASAGGAHGLYITAGNSRVRGLVINCFAGDGILLQGGTGNVVEACYLGTDATGNVVAGNGSEGIYVDGSTNAVLGGATAGARNVVAGNYRIGIYSLNGSTGAQVRNNYIGTNAAGTAGVANRVHGLMLENSGSATVTNNVSADNGADGIVLLNSGATSIMANFIGLSADGASALGNSTEGIYVQNSPNVVIGSPHPNDRNIIANSGRHGIYVLGGSTGVKVEGNFVGTDASGLIRMPSAVQGILIENTDAVSVLGNVVGNSGAVGLLLAGASHAVVQGNLLGVGSDGVTPMSNTLDGIFAYNSPHSLIGGLTSEARNIIAANHRYGILVQGNTTDLRVQGNSIGTDASGAANLGNTQAGIFIDQSSSNNYIGGTDAGAGNLIAHNGGDGVNVNDGIGNAILGNSIFANAGLGIDLGPDGVTPNDAGDADGGANHLQNFPIITSANSAGGTTNVQGTLDSAPNTQYRIELFANTALDPSGHGEGQTYLTATDVTTDANGRARFNVNVLANVGTLVSASATDAENNTSEFSNADADAPTLSLPANIFADATGPLGATVNFTATATDNSGQPVHVACLPESGQTFPHGTTTVRCSASDASGNTATGSFLITVGGNAPPVVPSNYAYVTTNSRPTQLAGLPAGRIDTSDAPVTDLPVNGNPGAMAVAPDGARAYVVSHATNTISVIETTTNEVVATFNTPAQPSGIAISPDDKRLYLITQSDNTLRAIDVATYQTVATYATGTGPISVAVAPDGSRVYVANFGSNNITIINVADGTTSSIENVPQPVSIGVLPDRPRLYVVSHLCCVKVIDMTTNQIVKSIGIADVPGALTVSPDGKFVYIAHPLPGGPVTVIDTTQEAWVFSYPVCCYPGNGVGNYAGTCVYGTSSGGNGGFIHSFDRDAHVELGRVRLGVGVDGAGPFSIALTPDSTTINFEHTPGADGLLGTGDDVPLAGGTNISDQFAALNVHFALVGGGTPNIATVDGPFVAYHGPGDRANYPARSGLNTLDASGQVVSTENPAAAAHGAGATLILHNVDVAFDPQGYAGYYYPHTHIFGDFRGRSHIVLVPNLTYPLAVGDLHSFFRFTLGEQGQLVSVDSPAAAFIRANTLVLKNACLSINPGGYGGSYEVILVGFGHGAQTLIFVPGLRYYFRDSANQAHAFDLDAVGQPTPAALDIPLAGQSYHFTLATAACDQTPPVTMAQLSTPPNSAGWHKANVTLTLSAADENGGTGVKEIVYSASGAQVVAQTTVSGASVALNITTDGMTTVTYFARDNAGNAETAHTLTIKLNKTAPAINIARPANNSAYALGQAVTASYSCTDGGAGVTACTGAGRKW